jgi:hypothetical protein
MCVFSRFKTLAYVRLEVAHTIPISQSKYVLAFKAISLDLLVERKQRRQAFIQEPTA